MATLRDTIRQLTATHLDANHLVCGQCLSAVGFVANTVPNDPRLTEFPMSDVAQSGFVVGAALVGRRPLYILRYQGFSWFNLPIVLNYAAKSKEIWGRPCPMLIRSIAMEGRIGPTSGSSHHALAYRMPGIKIFAPMTPGEWRAAYEEFMAGDDVVLLSEHRGAYDNDKELLVTRPTDPDFVIVACSITRFEVMKAMELWGVDGIRLAMHHIWRLKPFSPPADLLTDLRDTGLGVMIDDDYPDGVAKAIANDLSNATGARVTALGLKDRTAGFAAHLDNLPPTAEEIAAHVRRELGMIR